MEDLVGLISEEGAAWGLCDGRGPGLFGCHGDKQGVKGAGSKEGDAVSPRRPLSAEASSSTSTTTGAGCACNGLMDTEAPRGGLTCPRSLSKLFQEARHPNFQRLTHQSDSSGLPTL